jgi:hypothetical protein
LKNVSILTDGVIRTDVKPMTLIISRLKVHRRDAVFRSGVRVRNAGQDGYG